MARLFSMEHQMMVLRLMGRDSIDVGYKCNTNSLSFQNRESSAENEIEMVRQSLSQTYRSVKPRPNRNPTLLHPPKSSAASSSTTQPESKSNSDAKSWCVYLILSTNPPIKTYVGVTNNFSRRLKQHNGELKGGAKASRAGRPWVCACIIHGFNDQNEACEFESKWKSTSRKLSRKKKEEDIANKADDRSLPLLQHRQAALNRVKDLFDFSHLEIDWRLDPL